MTDNLDQKKNWQIPNGTMIGPGAFLLIWADNAATNSPDVFGNLHAGFQLSKGGEQIGLFTPALLTVDSVNFPAQQNNVSQGRYADGNFGGVLYFMTTPTPLATNKIPANQFAPVLPTLSNRSVNERATLTFISVATDSDSPAQTLTYSL